MKMINTAALNRLRSEYPVGSRVELLKMTDMQAPPVGTFGTVYGIDDTGSILVRWDSGSMLSVVLEAGDHIRKVGNTK